MSGFLRDDQYVAVIQQYQAFVVSTTVSQKGNGPVTSTSTRELSEPEESRECYVRRYANGQLFEVEPAPVEACDARGLYG